MIKGLLSGKNKSLSTILVVAEIVVIIFLLTVSLFAMFATDIIPADAGAFLKFISWLQANPAWMFILIVLPLITLFFLNIYLLVKTLYTENKAKKPTLSNEELILEAKRQAREEILKEMEEAKKKEANK